MAHPVVSIIDVTVDNSNTMNCELYRAIPCHTQTNAAKLLLLKIKLKAQRYTISN